MEVSVLIREVGDDRRERAGVVLAPQQAEGREDPLQLGTAAARTAPSGLLTGGHQLDGDQAQQTGAADPRSRARRRWSLRPRPRQTQHVDGILVSPLAGRVRDDVRPGMRTTTFEKRTLISYEVGKTSNELVVKILGIFHAGQNWEAALRVARAEESRSRIGRWHIRYHGLPAIKQHKVVAEDYHRLLGRPRGEVERRPRILGCGDVGAKVRGGQDARESARRRSMITMKAQIAQIPVARVTAMATPSPARTFPGSWTRSRISEATTATTVQLMNISHGYRRIKRPAVGIAMRSACSVIDHAAANRGG